MKYRIDLTLKDWVTYGSLSKNTAKFLKKAVQSHCTIILSGTLGTGKTSLLNALGACLDEEEKVLAFHDGFDIRPKRSDDAYPIFHQYYPVTSENQQKATSELLRKSWIETERDRLMVGDFIQGGVFEAFVGITDNKSLLGVLNSLGPEHTLERLVNIAKKSPIYEEETFFRAVHQSPHLIVHTELTEERKIRVKSISQVRGWDESPIPNRTEVIFDWVPKKGLKRTDAALSAPLFEKMGGHWKK